MKKIDTQELFGHSVYCLTNGKWTVYCDPKDGMNLCRILYDGSVVVDSDAKRRREGATYGVPILFPTPNRVRDLTFTFKGETYPARMHGIVRREPFEKIKTVVKEGFVQIDGTLSSRCDCEIYQMFPFEYDLTVSIRIYEDRIVYSYEVHNIGDKALPFGFALHPFYANEHGNARLQFSADQYMNMNEDCLPDGSLAEYTGAGHREPAPVDELDLNLVYIDPSSPAAVMWLDAGVLTMEMGPTFTHLVVYTPAGKPYFCVEPQTCSTDAHNLHAKGLIREAGLLIAEPGERIQDTVVFRMDPTL